MLQVGYISEYPHNPDRDAESGSHELEASALFWKSETVTRGKQTIYGNAWPGVEVKTGGNPTMGENTIHDGKGPGLHVHFCGLGRYTDNKIFQNR